MMSRSYERRKNQYIRNGSMKKKIKTPKNLKQKIERNKMFIVGLFIILLLSTFIILMFTLRPIINFYAPYYDDSTTIRNEDEDEAITKTILFDSQSHFEYGSETWENTSYDNGVIRSSEVTDIEHEISFDNADNYEYNTSKVLISGGSASLLGFSAGSKSYNFSNPSDYTYNESEIIIMDDKAYLNKTGNKYVNFDGVDEYIDCGIDTSLRLTNNFSCFAWINTTSTSTITIAGRYETTGDLRAWYMGVDTNYFMAVFSQDGTYNAGQRKFYRTDPNYHDYQDGNMHHVGFTYCENVLKLYFDGVEATTIKTYDDTISSIYDPAINLLIGARGTSISNYWVDDLDEVNLWNKNLTATEVNELYNNGVIFNISSHSSHENLVSWWRMGDEDSFPTLYDNKGSNDATMVNMELADIIYSHDFSGYITTDPILYSDGYSFGTAITVFSENSTKPNDTNIKYQMSYDNGSSWYWFNGSSWDIITTSKTSSWYYLHEANNDMEVNNNILSLAISGILRIKAFFHSDTGVNTSELFQINVEEGTIYSLENNIIEMKNDVLPVICFNWMNFSETVNIVNGTSIMYQFSIDSGISYNEEWLNLTELEAVAGAVYCNGDGSDKIRLRFSLNTSNPNVTPTIYDLSFYSESGYEKNSYYESGYYSLEEFVIWRTLTFSGSEPLNSNLTMYLKFSENILDVLYEYQVGIDQQLFNTCGDSFKFKVLFTSDGRDSAYLDWVRMTYWVNVVHEL